MRNVLSARLASLLALSLAHKAPQVSETEPSPAYEAPPEVPFAPTPVEVPDGASLTIAKMFDAKGSFVWRSVFRFNLITGVNLINRRKLLEVFAHCSTGEFMSMPFLARENAFKVIKREFQRYKGTAARLRDSEYGKAGEPLPRLDFQVKPGDDTANKRAALQYRALLEEAMANLTSCVRNKDLVS